MRVLFVVGARSRKRGSRKRGGLLELKFTEGEVKMRKVLPPIFVPNEKQLKDTAEKVGLKWENGRLVAEKGKLTRKKYEEFKKALREKMGLKGKSVTTTEAVFIEWLKKDHPEIYKDYLKGKYKTVQHAADMAILKEVIPSFYNKVKRETYEEIIQNHPEFSEILSMCKTKMEILNEGPLKGHVDHSKILESYREGRHRTVREALNEGYLKESYPERFAEFKRLVKKKGLTPERALKMLEEFEKKQARKKKAKKAE